MGSLTSDQVPVVLMVSGKPDAVAKRVADAAAGHVMDAAITPMLRDSFLAGRAIIAIGAVGAVVRLLAPHLADKRAEPPVVVVAPDGSSIVPLLGGHNGANQMARTLSKALGVPAAITTATDTKLGAALDVPPSGWVISPRSNYKSIAADILSGQPVQLDPNLTWLTGANLNHDGNAPRRVYTSVASDTATTDLVFHPKSLVIGVGCARNASSDALQQHVHSVLQQHDLAPESVAVVVSLDVKTDEPAIHRLAALYNVPARFFSCQQLAAVEHRLVNPSEKVKSEVGVAGVAEGAALAAVGDTGRLLIPKVKGKQVTVAVSQAVEPINPDNIGVKRGCLFIVGLGPGHAEEQTPLALAHLARSQHIVGLKQYFNYIPRIASDQVTHRFDLGEEQLRVRHALQLAASGRDVCLIGSGDASIYAMGALVFEEIEKSDDPAVARINVISAPGITALQSASARAGAPLGHDFCAISLSDLLTPWPVIENRLRAAARGDFVTAFYNPVSKRRRVALAKARQIFLDHRPKSTPVVIGRNLGRLDEQMSYTTLHQLKVDDADMLSVVLVGSSQTRAIPRASYPPWIYTPRGFAGKKT